MVVAGVKGEDLVLCGVFGVSRVGPVELLLVMPHVVQDTLPTVVRYQNLKEAKGKKY